MPLYVTELQFKKKKQLRIFHYIYFNWNVMISCNQLSLAYTFERQIELNFQQISLLSTQNPNRQWSFYQNEADKKCLGHCFRYSSEFATSRRSVYRNHQTKHTLNAKREPTCTFYTGIMIHSFFLVESVLLPVVQLSSYHRVRRWSGNNNSLFAEFLMDWSTSKVWSCISNIPSQSFAYTHKNCYWLGDVWKDTPLDLSNVK